MYMCLEMQDERERAVFPVCECKCSFAVLGPLADIPFGLQVTCTIFHVKYYNDLYNLPSTTLQGFKTPLLVSPSFKTCIYAHICTIPRLYASQLRQIARTSSQ